MYEELRGNLMAQATHFSVHDETSLLLLKAADAIEKLIEVIQNHDFLESLIKPDWIPVTERLPEDYDPVLTCDERGNIHIFRHLRQFRYPFGIRPEDPRYFMPKWWMPLPQPPESEKQNG